MSYAWVSATPTDFAEGHAPANQQQHGQVYGPLNSTTAETYALECAVVQATHQKTHRQHLDLLQPSIPLTHAQDNQGVLDTYRAMRTKWHVESQFISQQQLRPVWRRLRNLSSQLDLTIQPLWKKGHAQNADINAADALTKLSLHPIPLHEARAAFPDLNPFVEGMDDIALVWTFHPQPALPLSHPSLPENRPETRDEYITMRQDGNRTQQHELWTHLQTHEQGRSQVTYQWLMDDLRQEKVTHNMCTSQKGYLVAPKRPPKHAVTDSLQLAHLEDTLAMKEMQLIKNLRAGVWNVHDTTTVHTAEGERKIPALRICTTCQEVASLHHILCECVHPQIQHLRQQLEEHLKNVGEQPETCRHGDDFPATTPTNLVNVKWQLPGQPPPQPPSHGTPPDCLHNWLGLQHTHQQVPTKVLRARMHVAYKMVRTWMREKDNSSKLIPKEECQKTEAPPPPRKRPPPQAIASRPAAKPKFTSPKRFKRQAPISTIIILDGDHIQDANWGPNPFACLQEELSPEDLARPQELEPFLPPMTPHHTIRRRPPKRKSPLEQKYEAALQSPQTWENFVDAIQETADDRTQLLQSYKRRRATMLINNKQSEFQQQCQGHRLPPPSTQQISSWEARQKRARDTEQPCGLGGGRDPRSRKVQKFTPQAIPGRTLARGALVRRGVG
jgi:hypothetical protein